MPNEGCLPENYIVGPLKWSPQPQFFSIHFRNREPLDMCNKFRLIHSISDAKDSLTYRHLFITDAMIDRIVYCTNIEGHLKGGDKLESTNVREIQTSIGLWYLFGINGSSNKSVKDIFSSSLQV